MSRRALALSLLLPAALALAAEDKKPQVVPFTSHAEKDGLYAPFGVDFDGDGNLYFVEYAGHRLRMIDARGALSTIAGTGEKGDADGVSPKAMLSQPHSLAVAYGGVVYIADTGNFKVRKYTPKTGWLSTFAGTGKKGFSGDGGPAQEAQLGGVYCVSLDPKGERLYLADLDNRRVRVIDLKTNVISTVAGNGQKGVPEDGAVAREAPLVDPRAVCADDKGNVYILERGGHALRVVDAAGKIRTVAGTGKAGHSGDGGPAREAAFNGPKHLCMDRDGSVLIADTENHVIRRYLPKEGKVVRVAGNGKKGNALEELNQPHGVFVHPTTGAIYIADSSNNRILKIER
jgi:DNA-binding beta-propeller fold protein YncE